MQEKYLYIIGGCNGAGKTTASFNILPDLLNCKEFVNADEIARGLSPFQPESVSIENAKSKDYYVTLIFFWLDSIELAKDRVRKRVSEGGHNIETDVIERRYKAGIKNLFRLYCNRVDSLLIYDSSKAESELIAEKEIEDEVFTIYNIQKFNSIKIISNEQ
jgi:predicted ABC-type ATPase